LGGVNKGKKINKQKRMREKKREKERIKKRMGRACRPEILEKRGELESMWRQGKKLQGRGEGGERGDREVKRKRKRRKRIFTPTLRKKKLKYAVSGPGNEKKETEKAHQGKKIAGVSRVRKGGGILATKQGKKIRALRTGEKEVE